jgi:acetyltransferase-like isoleucine patch superfamily enzyme
LRKTVKMLIIVIAFQLPGTVRRQLFRQWLGWDIDSTAKVGLSVIDARHVYMGSHVRIGHFNVLRNLERLSLHDNADIGQWNWITSDPTLARLISDGGSLTLDNHSAVTSRHYLDCAGGISLGEFTIVAGIRSTILSHQIDLVESRQTVLPVTIGTHCFLGSDVRVTPGSVITDRCMVAMGAVVAKNLEQSGMMYGGVPAQPLKSVDHALYFRDPTNVWRTYLAGRSERGN